ncbi:MAG: outer membrane beta-barrel protein [Sphingomonas sp.]
MIAPFSPHRWLSGGWWFLYQPDYRIGLGKMKTMKCAAIMAGLIVVAPAGAMAQTGTPQRGITLGATAGVTYETNVARASRSAAVARGLTREDVRFTPGITAEGTVPFGRQSFTLSGFVGYDFYARNKQLNRERISLDSTLGLRFGRCDGSVQARYARRLSDLGDLGVVAVPASDRRALRNTEDIKTIGATVGCSGAVGLRPTATVEQQWADNSADFLKRSDFDSTTVSAGIGYVRPSFGTVTLFGRYQKTRFPNRVVVAGAGADGFNTKSAGISYERSLGSRLRGSAEVAYTQVNPDRPGLETDDGITWRVGLTAQPSTRMQVTANTSRAIEPTNRTDANYVINRTFDLGASYALSERVTLSAGAAQQRRRFVGALPVLGLALVKDQLWTYSTGVSFRQSDRLQFGLNAAYVDRNANGNIFDYSTARIGASVSLTF